jgi:hypothetical protein
LKAKQHEAMALEKVLYTWHYSSIYREEEPPSYKITIMPLTVLHKLFTNVIGNIVFSPSFATQVLAFVA